jgi:hypothetical protein
MSERRSHCPWHDDPGPTPNAENARLREALVQIAPYAAGSPNAEEILTRVLGREAALAALGEHH